MKLSKPKQQALLRDFKKAVTGLYGDRLDRIILYYSYARGDFSRGFGCGFLVVLKDEEVKHLAEIFKLSEVVHPLILKHNVEISYHPMALKRLEKERSPFLFWVRKDGVEVT